ncbi:MAG: LamG-like jellyroll fold domain-containing protein [Planctomycetaceae bacterium]
MRSFTVPLLALLAAIAGCGSSGGTSTPVAVTILSPLDRSTVQPPFVLIGRALGGTAEVSVDGGPFAPAAGGADWTFAVDAAAWPAGWHEIAVLVRSAGGEARSTLRLYRSGAPVLPPPPPPSPLPPRPPPPIDALALWTFAPSGANDTSGNGHHGEIRGPTATAGVLDGALRFDGIDDSVVVADTLGLPPAELKDLAYGSIALRFRYDSVVNGGSTADAMPLFHYGSGVASTTNWDFDAVEIYVGHGNLDDPAQRQIYFTVLKSGVPALCFDSFLETLEAGRWYHYAVTIGPFGHRAYLDGKELSLRYNSGTDASSYAFFPTVRTPELLAFGTSMFGLTRTWWHLDGAVDEVGIYAKVLSAEEVSALYADGP